MRNMKKILSFLLVLSMVLSYVPMPTLAAEGDPCTVTEGCEGTYNAEGICTVCNLAQLVVTEGAEECQHSGGTATCTALAVCEKCNEPYGELAAHTGGEATCKAQAVCTVCTAAYGELAAHSYENGVCAGCGAVCTHAEYAEGKCTVCGAAEPHAHTYTDGVCGCGEICNHAEYAEGKCTVCGAAEPCVHSGGTATCKDQAICEKCETAYGELAAHNYGTDADGKCDACGADCSHSYADGVCGTCGFACVHESYSEGKCAVCSAVCPHAEYLDGKCKVCGMDEPVPEPVVLTITAWSWVDEYEILSEDGTYATLPNAADWETLKSVLPTVITAIVDGAEVEIPVQWECETFPTEGKGQGTYELKAILPEGYALSEDVAALKLEVDLGTAQQYAITPIQPANGDGSESNPYQITSAGELYWFAEYVNAGNSSACAKLMNDITVNENVIVNGALNSDTSEFIAWTPIGVRVGASSKVFSGTFDGGNHTISGLYVSDASGYQGLIGFMESGTVKNVTVANSYFSGTTNIGAVVGCYGQTGTASVVTNCHNVGSVVIASDYYVGGIVGGQYAPATSHAQIVVSDCSNSGSVTGAQHYVGGIIGYAEYFSEGAAISNCTNTGTITCTSTSRNQGTGGIAGYFGGSSAVKVEIVGCTNSGTIQITEGGKQDYMGGIIGRNSYGHISGCNNTGTISGYQFVGGIVGTNSGTVTNCQNTGTVSATGSAIGGIAGTNSGTVTGCTNSADVQGQGNVGGINGSGIGTGLLDCTNTGDVTSNTSGAGGVIGYVDAAGTVKNCHNEGDVKGTHYIGGLVGYHYSGKVNYTECSNKGNVEGSSYDIGGLFGRITDSSVVTQCYNTGNVTCTGTYSTSWDYGVGGLAGATFNAAMFENCYNTGAVNGGSNQNIGGLVGFFTYASGSTNHYIKNSHNTGSVTGGKNTGGLFGSYEAKGVSENCYNTGVITGGQYTGGLVGYHKSTGSGEGVIKNCYNIGSISGTSYVGGLFGYSYYNNCLETSYNVGTVSGTSSIGGVIGNSSNNKSVTNCYYLDTCVTNGKTVTGATALTAQQMTDDTNWQTNFAGFDTTTPVWSKQNNEGTKKYLPKLDSYSPTLHVHNWTYSADGSTITATCNVDGCTNTAGGTVTISAPTDLVYSNSSKDAACSYSNWLPDKEETIVYNTVDRINVTGMDITASITIGGATASVSYQITPRKITTSMVTLSPSSANYDGSEKTVTVTVKYNSTTLTAGTDYKVTGTTSATAISTGSGYAVTVTGKGNYTGEVTKYWKINKHSFSSAIEIEGWTYGDSPKAPSVTNNPENGEVTYTYYSSIGRRPVMTGPNNGAQSEGGVPTYAGTYYVGASIAETDHYKKASISPSNDTKFVISPREVSDPTFEGLRATYPYDNGNEIKPAFTLKDDLGNVIPESEYTVVYSNNTAFGTASITVTDNEGGNYVVSGSKTFKIVEHEHVWTYAANGATITATCSDEDSSCPNTNGGSISIAVPDSVSYTGNAIEAKVTNELTTGDTVTVVYFGDSLKDGKPVIPGTYTAKIILGNAEISVEYTITDVLIQIDVTADSGNPVAVPTKDTTKTIILTAKAKYDYGGYVDVTTNPETLWTLQATYAGVTLENNKLTLTSEATSGAVVVDAAYGGKTGGMAITLSKEKAGVLNALGEINGPDSISLSGKIEPQTGTYTITGEDIYGAAVTPTVTWSVTGHDGVTIDADGKLIVPVNVPNGTELTIQATSDTLSKTKEVTVISHVHSWTYSVNEAKDTITATCSNEDRSCPNTAGGTVTISASNATYDGTAKTAALTAETVGDLTNLSDLIQYQKKDGENWITATTTAPTDAGTYKASLTVDTDKTISVEYTIAQKPLTIKALEQTISYGEALDSTKITNTGLIDGHSVTATLTPSTTNATTNGKITPSNAVIKNGDKDVTTNYAISYADGDLIINKANTSISFNGYAPGKTYDAQPLANPTEGELTISGAAYADVTFAWYKDSVDEANKLTAAPKDAGTYYVVASIAETANTEASSVTSNPITISKRDITGATITLGTALTYTGKEQTQTVTEVKVGDVVVDDYTISGNNGTNFGTYTLTVTGNGNFTGTATKTWSIGKAEPSYSTPTGLTATYGQTLANVSLPTGWTWENTNTSVGDVGSNSFPAVFTPGDTSNYSTVEVNLIVAVAPKEVTVSSITATNRAYNGTTVVALTGGVVNGVISGDTVSVDLSKAVANTADANVGNGKAVTITGVALDGADAANYTLTAQPTGVTVNITKASATAENGELTITNRLAKTYNVDLAELLPALETGKSYGDVSYTVAAYDLQGYNSAAPTITDDVLSVPVRSMNSSEEGSFGTITISFTTDNFTVSNATITVKRTNKATVTITGVTAASGLTYSGNAQAGYTGTPAVQGYTGTFDVIYTGTGNTTYGPSTTAPTNAGTYSVKITIPETHETLAGETTLNFTIAKAAVTITAEDKTAVEGDAKPAFTYTVTGLKGTDKLTTAPTMTCTVDMSKPGDYAITPSNAQAGDNYSIAYVAGKLTVKQKHNVKIADTTNGSVTTNVSKAAEGTEVAITVTPKSGYKLSTLTVKDAAGKSYVVSTDNNGKYYFTMPDADVTVTATFKKISTAKADPTNPKTGDDFQLVLWSSILCGSVLGVAILLTDNKKRIH